MTLKKQTLFYFAPNVLSALVSLVTFPLIVKTLSVEAYGDYGFLSSVAGLVGMIAALGLATAFSRYLYSDTLGWREKYAALKTIYILYTTSLIVLGLLGIVILSWFYDYPSLYYVYTFFLIFFRNIRSLPFDTLRKKERVTLIMKVSICEKLLLLLLIAGLYVNESLTIQTLLMVVMFQVFSVAIIYLYFFDLHRIRIKRHDKTSFKEIFSIALPAMPATFANWVINLSDRIFLMSYQGAAAVGIYTANLVMEIYMSMFILALHNATYPKFIKWLQGGEAERVWHYTERMLIIFAVMVVGFALFMKEFLLIFARPEYFIGNGIFVLIGNSMFLFFASHMYQSSLMAQDKIKYIGLAKGSAAVINVALNFWLIPVYSIYGAAVSTLIAYAVSQLLLFRLIGFGIAFKTNFWIIWLGMNVILALYLWLGSLNSVISLVEFVVKGFVLLGLCGLAWYYSIKKVKFTEET